MHIEYRPKQPGEKIERPKFTVTTERIYRVARRCRGKHLWATGYGAWSTGNLTEEMVEEYLRQHKSSANDKDNFKLD